MEDEIRCSFCEEVLESGESAVSARIGVVEDGQVYINGRRASFGAFHLSCFRKYFEEGTTESEGGASLDELEDLMTTEEWLSEHESLPGRAFRAAQLYDTVRGLANRVQKPGFVSYTNLGKKTAAQIAVRLVEDGYLEKIPDYIPPYKIPTRT